MTDLTDLEAEIKAACRAWVQSGKRLARGTGFGCSGCALDALATAQIGHHSRWNLARVTGRIAEDFMRGFDYGDRERASNSARQLGARVAAWAESEGLL